MESGDHPRSEKIVSSSVEHSKLQQHPELGMIENLHKSEELGFAGDKHLEHQAEDFLFGGGVKKDKRVPSTTDINQFILHESRTNVPIDEGLLPAHTTIEQPTEENKNEDLSDVERTRLDLGPNGSNQTASEIVVANNGQAVTESNAEGNSQSINRFSFTQSDNENIISQDRLNESVSEDSSNTNSQANTDLSLLQDRETKPTDTEDIKSNVELICDDLSSNRSNGKQGEPLSLSSEMKSETENVRGTSDDSNNSFISNERSEIQGKTESDEISEAERQKQFLSHEGDSNHPAGRNEQNELDVKHPTFTPTEKGDSVKEEKKTESFGVAGETDVGGNQEDVELNTSGKQEEKCEDTDNRAPEQLVSKDEIEDEWLDILGTGHLKKKIIKKAENEYRPQSLQICEINLEGRLEDGTVVEKFENLKIQIGDVEVVQGIDLALPLMNVGEIALLEMSARFAYGTVGRSPDIPPNAKLIYTIELLSAEDEPELESLSIARRKELGDKKRERGNWWFSRQEYSFAIQSYRRAIEFLDEAEGGFSIEKKDISEDAEKQLQELLEDRLKVFNNLAAAQMKIKAYDAALTSVDNVLRCQPQNVKALFRKGKILAAKGDTTAALSVLRNASQLEPESKVIKQEVQRILDVIKRDTKQEKSLYKKMLGQNKSTEKTATKGSRISYRTWGIACSSVAVVLLGAIAYRYKFL